MKEANKKFDRQKARKFVGIQLAVLLHCITVDQMSTLSITIGQFQYNGRFQH
jgi:hypothetical protein